MSKLILAITIANQAHMEQLDKGDKPYILHPLRVMMNFEEEDKMIIAVLHDVMEDTNLSSGDLLDYGFNFEIIRTLVILTKRKNEPYMDYINRIKQNAVAIDVKIADLKDNMSLGRIVNPTIKDFQRNEKYQRALDILEQKI